MYQDLRHFRRDFATLLREIFGEQAGKDIWFDGGCGDAISAIISSLQGRENSCMQSWVENFGSISLLGEFGSPDRGLRLEGG